MLHFAGHKMLFSSATWKNYMEIATNRLLPVQRLAISDTCRHVFTKQRTTLPYSASKAQFLTPEGDLVSGELGAGFTCANFVAELFRTRGCALVDFTTWPQANSSDRTFFKTIFDTFTNRFPWDKSHFKAAQNPDATWSRLLPEQLAAAARIAPPAAVYDQVREKAKHLKRSLTTAYGSIDHQ